MRIGLGVTVLRRGLSHNKLDGIGHYTQALEKGLLQHPDHSVFSHQFKSPIEIALSGLTNTRTLGGRDLEKKIDLFHAPDHWIPKLNVPVIATIHDVIPLAHPEWGRNKLLYLKNYVWRKAASRATHIITDSNYSKQEIIKYFSIAPPKISVISLGVETHYFEKIAEVTLQEVSQKLNLPAHFYLFIGTLQPRKNIERLILAHQQLSMNLQKSVPLVIVGSVGWQCEALIKSLNNETVRWLNYVSDLEKRVLLQRATAFVLPSLYEGFGLPVIEAFASELPVITSSTTSLPEVADDAALLVNPMDVDELSEAMQKIIEQEELRSTLRIKGLLRAKLFTWEKCIAETIQVYENVL